jgi:hypothetical protein
VIAPKISERFYSQKVTLIAFVSDLRWYLIFAIDESTTRISTIAHEVAMTS